MYTRLITWFHSISYKSLSKLLLYTILPCLCNVFVQYSSEHEKEVIKKREREKIGWGVVREGRAWPNSHYKVASESGQMDVYLARMGTLLLEVVPRMKSRF